MGEPMKVLHSESLERPGFYPTFLLLVISANLLTYSQFLCASVCSALTTSLVGVGKSVIQTIIGFFTFGGVQFHPLNVAGKSNPSQLTINSFKLEKSLCP